MARILIAYHSRGGNTRRLGEAAAKACGAETFEIREEGGPRSLPLALLDLALGRRPKLAGTAPDLSAFAVVALGSPVWAGAPTPPARAFAERLKAASATPAFFCTMGGAGGDRTLAALERTVGRAPAATLAVTEKDLKSGDFEAEARRFAEALAAAAGGEAP